MLVWEPRLARSRSNRPNSLEKSFWDATRASRRDVTETSWLCRCDRVALISATELALKMSGDELDGEEEGESPCPLTALAGGLVMSALLDVYRVLWNEAGEWTIMRCVLWRGRR